MNKKEILKTFKVGSQELVDIACHDILKLINKNIDILLNDLPALAYILWKWDRLAHAGRHLEPTEVQFDNEDDQDKYYDKLSNIEGIGLCEDNPKYALEYVLNTIKDESIRDLVYSAWGVSISNEDYDKFRYSRFYSDDDCTPTNNLMKINPNSYKKIREKHSDNFLFCVIGTGLMVSDGNIVPEVCDIPVEKYAGWEGRKDSLPKKVSKKFFEIINREECKFAINATISETLSIRDPINTKELHYAILRIFKDTDITISVFHVETEEQYFEECINILNNVKSEYRKASNLILNALANSNIDNYGSISNFLEHITNLIENEDISDMLASNYISGKVIHDSVYHKRCDEDQIKELIHKHIKSEDDRNFELTHLNKIVSELTTPKKHSDGKLYPVCNYSLICKYAELNDDYAPALISIAEQLLKDESQPKFGHEIANEVLEYFKLKSSSKS